MISCVFCFVQQSKVKSVQTARIQAENLRSSSNSSSAFTLTDQILSTAPLQLKGLVDGMTRFFTPTGDRKRNIPLYAPPARKRKDTDKSGATRSAAEESDGAGMFSDGAKSDGTGKILTCDS